MSLTPGRVCRSGRPLPRRQIASLPSARCRGTAPHICLVSWMRLCGVHRCRTREGASPDGDASVVLAGPGPGSGLRAANGGEAAWARIRRRTARARTQSCRRLGDESARPVTGREEGAGSAVETGGAGSPPPVLATPATRGGTGRARWLFEE